MSINDQKTLADFIPNYPTKGDKTTYIVKKGKSNNNVSSQIELESVINSIKNVQDPEIPVNIYDLGLIYDIEILSNNDVKIKMSIFIIDEIGTIQGPISKYSKNIFQKEIYDLNTKSMILIGSL